MLKEFKQMKDGAVSNQHKPVIQPTDPNTAMKTKKEQAMDAFNLIKEERDEMIKGRCCPNGSKQ